MPKGSVAPRERINITYKPDGDAQEEKELPFKVLAIGDYTLREDDTPLEERKPVNVNKKNFADVLEAQKLNLHINVEDKLPGERAEFSVNLDITSMRDFEPGNIAKQVPELSELLKLREALLALKGPLGNVPEFRKKMQALMSDEEKRDAVMNVLGLDDK